MQLLARGFIYIAFVVAAIAGWYLKKRRSQKKQTRSEPAPTAEPLYDLTGALNNPKWQIRLQAVRLLAEQASTEALPLLIESLSDPDNDVRNAAVDALSHLGPAATAGLIGVLQDGAVHARESAAQALGFLADPAAVPALAATLRDDESVWVRLPAAQALGRIGGPEATAALMAARQDANPDVARTVQLMLHQVRQPTA